MLIGLIGPIRFTSLNPTNICRLSTLSFVLMEETKTLITKGGVVLGVCIEGRLG